MKCFLISDCLIGQPLHFIRCSTAPIGEGESRFFKGAHFNKAVARALIGSLFVVASTRCCATRSRFMMKINKKNLKG